MSIDRPLRVLHLTAASDAGGLSRYILDLCAAMHRHGHQVAVAGGRGAWHDRFASQPWQWIDLNFAGGPMGVLRAARQLERYLGDHPVDILHTHYRRTTLTARRVQKKIDLPILYTLHQPRISLSAGKRWLSDFGDWAHVPSADARNWLIEDVKFPADRTCLIPHGIDPARFPLRDAATRQSARQSLHIPLDAQVAAFVGRLDVPKNADWMIDVAKAVANLIVLVAGDGPHAARLRRRAARFGDRFRMLGECDPLSVYQAADALLSPSQREGFSFVVAEAMSVGLPVLRTKTGGAAEMVLEGITGRTTPIDRRAFAAAAREFFADPAALAKMGTAAAGHIRANFTFDRQLTATEALYRRVIEWSTQRKPRIVPAT